MKITTTRLLHAAQYWNTKTTNRVILWTNGFVRTRIDDIVTSS
jgi:hypothetical protein